MIFEMMLPFECFEAKVTGEWVNLQLKRKYENKSISIGSIIYLNYMWTSIGPVFFQAVSLHIAFLTESKAADFTLKRLILGMN
jgi:hypothetical protein